MSLKESDKLLLATRFALRAVQFIAIFAAVIIALMIPVLWVKQDFILAELATQAGRPYGRDSLVAITLILVGALAMLSLALAFVGRLLAIVGSVEEGSPFIPANARRLREMGWIVLAAELLGLLAMPLGEWISDKLPDGRVDFSLSLEGLITAMLLFVLARVFDRGSALEADVEGTV